MYSTCKHCYEPIVLIAGRWLHSKSDAHECAEPTVAEPLDMEILTAAEATGYERGYDSGFKQASKIRRD